MSRDVLEKEIFAQLVKTPLVLYGSRASLATTDCTFSDMNPAHTLFFITQFKIIQPSMSSFRKRSLSLRFSNKNILYFISHVFHGYYISHSYNFAWSDNLNNIRSVRVIKVHYAQEASSCYFISLTCRYSSQHPGPRRAHSVLFSKYDRLKFHILTKTVKL
jgi:hypothetical protein